MLHYLDPIRFSKKFMKVRAVDERPKQEGSDDCGVYVCKYIDAMLNGIQLSAAHWDPIHDIRTFRYRMAWELVNGAARHMADWGVEERLKGI